MTEVPSAPRAPRGAGVLTQTEVEAVDLGEHQGRRLRVDVEHRTVRIAWGRRQSVAFTFGRRRPIRIAVGAGDDGGASGERYDVAIHVVADPWQQAARRILVVAGACWLATALATRWRRGRGDSL